MQEDTDKEGSLALSKNALLTARGIGILAVVIGHVHVAYPLPYVFFWHIPLFFFLVGAGVPSRRPMSKAVRYVAVEVILYLFLWSLVYGVIVYFVAPFSLMNLHFPNESLLTSTTIGILTLNSHSIGLLSACWFLIAYAGVSILCTAIAQIVPRQGYLLVAAVLMAGGWLLASEQGYKLGESFPLLPIGQVLVGSGFCMAGAAFFASPWVMLMAISPAVTVLAIVVSGTLLAVYDPIPISMSGMSLDDNILSAVTIALCSIQVVLWLAHHLQGWIWLRTLGKQSKAIMTHHLLGVALVNLVFVGLGVFTLESVSTYTVYEPQKTWFVYVAVAIGVPLAIVWVTSRMREKIPFRYWPK